MVKTSRLSNGDCSEAGVHSNTFHIRGKQYGTAECESKMDFRLKKQHFFQCSGAFILSEQRIDLLLTFLLLLYKLLIEM
jgi:hypothetical protein